MSSSMAIGKVSESLRYLLKSKMEFQNVSVTIRTPHEIGGKKTLINLFLYKIQENPALKNMDWQVKKGNPNQIVPPPLSLNLFYLMTPYVSDTSETCGVAAHELLGDAMRVFYENPIVPEDCLAQELQDAREEIKIMLNTLDLEELSRVWNTFTQPFRLSVLYEVSVVQLDMLPEKEKQMTKRVKTIGEVDDTAPFHPPVVEGIDPVQGHAGERITVSGKNLSDWKAYVTLMGQEILRAQKISGDSFEVTLPSELLPGFHEMRVDISHLFRRTFFFEVLA